MCVLAVLNAEEESINKTKREVLVTVLKLERVEFVCSRAAQMSCSTACSHLAFGFFGAGIMVDSFHACVGNKPGPGAAQTVGRSSGTFPQHSGFVWISCFLFFLCLSSCSKRITGIFPQRRSRRRGLKDAADL